MLRGRRRWIVLGALLVALVTVALLVPLPTPVQLRDWADGAGPLAPLLFLLAHAVITTTPLPRTAFTFAAGLMFGPWWGLALCILASTISALIGFAVARRLGGAALARLGPGRVRALEERLCRRGLLTVTSVRLVPAIPFAPLNYTLGVTSVGMPAYLLGTAVGLVPGTAAMVLLGDAVTGGTSPTMLVVFVASGAVGVLGVLLSARGRRRVDDPAESGDPAPSAAAG